MKIIEWEIDPDLKIELGSHYQAKRSFEAKNSHPQEIINEYTFSFGAQNLSFTKINSLFDFVERVLRKKISGVGLEVGSGPGTHVALLANRKFVRKMYGVEASEHIVKNLMPKVSDYLAKDNSQKIVGVVGSFSNLELPDNSLDFVFNFFSLHHTSDLGGTLKEINRVVKPGGFLFCFDKAREDSLSDKELSALLDTEYSKEFKKIMGVPVDKVHTRRMNGENEYRRRDWLEYLRGSGFNRVEHFNLARTKSSHLPIRILKTLYSFLPPRTQAFLSELLPLSPTNNISPRHRVYSSLLNNYHKEISLIVGYK